MKIEIKNLQKVFRTDSVQTMALNNVSFNVNDGEFVAIMGPSGCGKSTLLNILGLLDNPSSGEYILDGKEVGKLRENQRTEYRKGRIGFIFQSFNLIEDMNIRDNIMLPLNNLPLSREEKNKRVEEAMTRMGISHRSRHYPSQLSGGQQQRAAIARAIVSRPGLILADEPTGNLDSRNGLEVMELLSELHREGATIIMVTHSQRDAANADYIINLFDGQIVETLNDRM
ncbi:MAG: ABC transporter ATP-binding protein [Muribaculaceae bacterium]|nr:ABC transporter ATP-binding protein [Muribaculaceae bacterium]